MNKIDLEQKNAELKEEIKTLKKLREKELKDVREQVKRELELENIAKRIIKFINKNKINAIFYPSIPISITIKEIDTDLDDETNYRQLNMLCDFVNLNLDTLCSIIVKDDNDKYKWNYLNIFTYTSMEDNVSLMKHLINFAEIEENIDIHNKGMWTQELYDKLILK